MKLIRIFFILLLAGFSSQLNAQDCGPINAARLRSILVELGNNVKDLNTTAGKEKFEVSLTTPTLNVPIGFEISASTNFIWMTVFLGKPFEEGSPKNLMLLKRNSVIQPCQFYITEKGNLMCGMALENRAVTNAVVRKFSDQLAKRVSDNTEYWKQD